MKIRVVPMQPHVFLYGGFDMQMVRTIELLQSVGVNAKPLNFWSQDDQFDILHIWGLDRQHLLLSRTAKTYGKKIVMTPLLPYLSPLLYLRHWAGIIEGRKKVERDILKNIDLMLVVNDFQAETAIKLYGFPESKIKIVPTILDKVFFEKNSDRTPISEQKDYLICVGNILPRKNQLEIARAAIKSNSAVMFVGNELAGDETYIREFDALVSASPLLSWHKDFSPSQVFRAMINSKGVVMPSFVEVQPTAALEAVALGKPLMLADRPYAYQEFYRGSLIIDPSSTGAIAKGLLLLKKQPELYTPKSYLVADCNPKNAALRLKSIFEELY
jgi:glycosyltransferase involved in cell wall biosynthesis